MAHDIYVGVIRGDHASPREQVVAARVASVIVGIMAITIGILAKGQNVAHLVALAFAVAASSNLPAIFLTLYWKKCNTGGIVLGMTVGALTAIGLVLVSPNMTYPLLVKEAEGKVIQAQTAKIAKLEGDLANAADTAAKEKLAADIKKAEAAKAASQKKIADLGDATTSIMGLERPLFELKNPGLISIPLGFLMVFVGSLLFRDKRAEEMWDELYVRQNTGIHAEGASAH
jgi:cation/acetate symporter